MAKEVTLEEVERAIETPPVKQRIREIAREAIKGIELGGKGVLEVVREIGKEMKRPESMDKLKGLSESLHKGMTSGDVSILDIGDVEAIRVGADTIISIPKGKEAYLIHRGVTGLSGTTIKKLEEVV
jgi:hypothetical protein